ncbi:MAG: phytanoyl-CoA dioxygenase family protein [Actinobacteria bacterium]|nr:phytanoyl-CoA dioxygenase family protein [Actinomycetota bacterium]MCB9389820.1 phytanoyl-CoA dioxygenase family protein [Acidimicrobiia bacterium]
MIDRYPSRVGAVPEIIERHDPVVWNAEIDGGPLSAEQLAHYADAGYVIIEDVLTSDEAERLNAYAQELIDAAEGAIAVNEPDSSQRRSLFAVHESDPKFSPLTRTGLLAAAARQILGSGVYVHQSRINCKRAFVGKAFPWHSDFETWHVEDGMPAMRALSCSLALTENTAINGPLMVIPGSHRSYASCAGRTPERHFEESLRRQSYGVPEDAHLSAMAQESEIVAVKMRPGSVCMFDCNLMHGSPNNMTPYDRTNLFVVFNSVANRLVEPFGGTEPRPTYLASR